MQTQYFKQQFKNLCLRYVKYAGGSSLSTVSLERECNLHKAAL
jgi:hypothetical protein